MVAPPGPEVPTKAGSGSGRDAVQPEQGDVEHREVAAHRNHAVLGFPADPQRLGFELEDARDDVVDRPQVLVGQPIRRNVQPHQRRPVAVDQHAPDRGGQGGRIGLEAVDRPAVHREVDGRHRPRPGVEVEWISGG